MNWYRDISKNYGKLGLKNNPQWVFVKLFCLFIVVIYGIVYILMNLILS